MARRVQLIHWEATDAQDKCARLEAAGYVAVWEAMDPAALRRLLADPPDAVVIDLGRLPAQGRDVAVVLRRAKATRHLPLVFVDGPPEKVDRIRSLLPDAVYCSWARAPSALRRALAKAPRDPVVPQSVMAGYAHSPLPKKLGIKAGNVVAILGAPESFVEMLGELPENVTLRTDARGRRDLTIWFVRSLRDLERRIDRLAAQVAGGSLWIAWPKKTSDIASDLSQSLVRRVGLAAGLVDYKICRIDATWAGLRFAVRSG